ncbi:3044_t:CDS:2, partial [Gigaspora margarita]
PDECLKLVELENQKLKKDLENEKAEKKNDLPIPNEWFTGVKEFQALTSSYPKVDFEILPNHILELQSELQGIFSNHDLSHYHQNTVNRL